MNLSSHDQNLYTDAISKIGSGDYQIDNPMDSPSDNRFGLTLLIRPNQQAKDRIRNLLDNLKRIEPNQYYYPDSDIHITVLTIISCYPELSYEWNLF